MPHLKLTNVSVSLPVFGAAAASLKQSVLATLAGGRFKTTGGVTSVLALDDVSLTLREGDRLGVYGHNGAGKTTLLRTLAGYFPPQTGTVLRGGTVASFVDPMFGMDLDATGYENIHLRGLAMRLSTASIARLTPGIAEFSGLGDYLSMPLRAYSAGMLMRLGFAITTSVRADILLLDEWLSTGDAEFRERAERRMREIIDHAGILVLATHSPELIHRECNRAIQLERGRVVTEKTLGPAPARSPGIDFARLATTR